MTELDGVQVRMDAYIDEAWLFRPDEMLKDPAVKRDAFGRVISIPRFPSDSHWFKRDDRGAESRPGVVTLTPEMMPLHSHESISVALTHGHQINHNHRFDPSIIKRNQFYQGIELERDSLDITSEPDVTSWLKAEMIRMLNEEVKKEMHAALFGDGQPISQEENYMSDRQLRSPETPIETKDLTVAGRVLGFNDLDYLLDAVALVQSLESNQRLVRGDKLKVQDLNNHVQIPDGVGGVMTDIATDHRSDGKKAVLDGKMVEIGFRELVVVTALAN